jgi:hypothetical protein
MAPNQPWVDQGMRCRVGCYVASLPSLVNRRLSVVAVGLSVSHGRSTVRKKARFDELPRQEPAATVQLARRPASEGIGPITGNRQAQVLGKRHAGNPRPA